VSVPDGDDLIIVASKGGAPDHPAWYRNLAADTRVWVRNKADFHEAEAVVLEGDERSAAWAKMVEAMAFFDGYQKKTDRVIPVIRLVRTA
jgi:deazaflavin-dependent oxidoreductase (nitroreductase family)